MAVPRPEVDVSRTLIFDFRLPAEAAIERFRCTTGRFPNFLGVSLRQVEAVEALPTSGQGIVSFMAVPLLFVEALGGSINQEAPDE